MKATQRCVSANSTEHVTLTPVHNIGLNLVLSLSLRNYDVTLGLFGYASCS